MKILLLADANSSHVQKWAIGLVNLGVEVALFSFNRAQYDWYSQVKNLHIVYQPEANSDSISVFQKLGYLLHLSRLKKAIDLFRPDIIHAHYASSYGLLGALSNFHPFLISVWGSDVYNFPEKSFLHKSLLKYNLGKANRILSTSEIMRVRIQQFTNKKIEVTPFGVDIERFSPKPKTNLLFKESDIVIGQVKALEPKYGTEILLRSFALAVKQAPHLPLKLFLVGTGSLLNHLKNLANKMGIAEHVVFQGSVPHDLVPEYHNMIDIFVSVSIDDSESFGVSAVEACSCAKAVIVARTGGLKEVIVENETGLIVEKNNVEQTTKAIIKFAENVELRTAFGNRAREHVLKFYSWNENLLLMKSIYHEVLKVVK